MESERIMENMREMVDSGIFIDPLVVHNHHNTYPEVIYKLSQDLTDTLMRRYGHIEDFGAGLEDFAYSPVILRACFEEALLSTATVIVKDQSGETVPTAESLVQAAARLTHFVSRLGVDRLYIVYYVITGHDLMQPHYFHRDITESEFLDGARHYPYRQDLLFVFLVNGLARRVFRYKLSGTQRLVSLTKSGGESYRWTHQVLVDSGYMAKRIALSYMYQFNTVEDWDALCNVVWPETDQKRMDYVNWIGIEPGDHVLEVACGTGALTFEGKLYESVGDTGHLTAIDIASGMLEQASRKHLALGKPASVTFQKASVEHLPFVDRAFDAVVGSGFLHFVDPHQSLLEMKRTVKPGGIISVFQPSEVDLVHHVFFREWFEPIFELARRRGEDRPKTPLPNETELLSYFRDIGLHQVQAQRIECQWIFDDPEITVQHIVRGVSLFQTELMEIPWDDRKSIINELIDRGRDVRHRYALADRAVTFNAFMLRGKRPKS